MYGSGSVRQRRLRWRYFKETFADVYREFDFVLHTRLVDLDIDRCIPGVFPTLELWLTDHTESTVVHNATRLIPGPIVIQSDADVVLLAVVEGTGLHGQETQTGLFRVPHDLMRRELDEFKVRPALLGTVDQQQQADWMTQVDTRFETFVRLTFPPHHGVDQTVQMYDCIPDAPVRSTSAPCPLPVSPYEPSRSLTPVVLSDWLCDDLLDPVS